MALIDSLRAVLADPGARSFQLMGEDLALVDGAALREAALRYEGELERVPPPLRPAHEREMSALLRDAHAWLRRHNRTMHTRVRGYLELGTRCGFEYPWPVVAVLGICQVMDGMLRSRVYGLLGKAAGRVGIGALSELAAGLDDVLLRTNRGIFADSVPITLLALRCHARRASGERELAEALLSGPLPPIMDEESRSLARAIYEGLAVDEGPARFERLGAVTLQHFAREQAIFSHHLGKGRRRPPSLLGSLLKSDSVPAPRIVATRRGPELAFRPYRLPDGFDIHDHDARVEHFGDAFVRSVTATPEGYGVALRHVVSRFGRPGQLCRAAFAGGGAPVVDAQLGSAEPSRK